MSIDPKALLAIESMELRTRIVIDGLQLGLHRSRDHGFSVEFSEYRNYTPGDDLKHLDWKVMARTDRPYLKQFEAETNLRVQILLDQSRSMAYASDDNIAKFDYATTLAATLAIFLMKQGDLVGLTKFDTAIATHLPPMNNPAHFKRIFSELESTAEGDGTSLDEPLQRVAEMQSRRGFFILISDLLAPIDQLESRLAMLRARGNDVAIIRPLDPNEIDPEFEPGAQLQDLESKRSIAVDLGKETKAYKQRFQEHEDRVQKICDDKGIDYITTTTDKSLSEVLRQFLVNHERLTTSSTSKGIGSKARL